MKGYRFYEELTDPERRASAGNVIAVQVWGGVFVKDGNFCVRALCADDDVHTRNAPVAPTYFKAEYLGKHCRRVSEQQARDIHPKLFEYLDRLA